MDDGIRILNLPAMETVSFYGFGENPEDAAISLMMKWSEEHQYFSHANGRCFGFNNPDPTPGSKNYGYEIWLTIPDGIDSGDTPKKQFSGGLYAVAHCSGMLADAFEFIPAAWKNLMEWLESSSYKMGKHQWLEEQLGEDGLSFVEMPLKGRISLDLYMPILA
jgi:DNA gyrase inhibitor GyrI